MPNMRSITFYTVYEGMLSPRDGTIGWRSWDQFATLLEAKQEAKKLPIAKIEECREVWVSDGVVPATKPGDTDPNTSRTKEAGA